MTYKQAMQTKLCRYFFPNFFITCALLIVVQNTCAQEVRGLITDSLHKPLIRVGVILKMSDTSSVLSYAISDNQGQFSIATGNLVLKDSVLITVSAVGYATISKWLTRPFTPVRFILHSRSFTLPKVVITSTPPPISRRGDTLNYNVSSFANKTDRSIADVLARMPGIEVRGDGQVLYQGRPIQKYYIEGLDLLEGRYSLANNNLPHADVQSVQVLEKHQPIRILDSLLPSDKTSLNIKLKKTVTFTGTAKAGAGVAPFLWEVNLTPMFFTKSSQMIASYQTNNTGYDVGAELKVLTLENLMEQMDGLPPKSDLFNVAGLQRPPVAQRRYLNNRIHMPTINVLNRLSNEWELRLNASYINDRQEQEGKNRTVFNLPSGAILLQEEIQERLNLRSLQASANLYKNGKKGYFKNLFQVQANEGNRMADVRLTNSATIFQQLNNPYFRIENRMQTITIWGKQLFTFRSYVALSRTPQSLHVMPGVFTSILNNGNNYGQTVQRGEKEQRMLNQSVETTKGWGAFTAQLKVGYDWRKGSLRTTLLIDEKEQTGVFANHQQLNLHSFSIQPSLSLRKGKWMAQTLFPTAFTSVRLSDPQAVQSQKEQEWILTPLVSLRLEANARWTFSTMASYNNAFQPADQILYGYVLYNYRTLAQTAFPLAQIRQWFGMTNAQYQNPVTGFFAATSASYNRTRNPFLVEAIVQPSGTQQIRIIQQANTANTVTVNGRVSQYVKNLQTTFNLGLEWRRSNSFQAVNGEIVAFQNQTMRPSLKISSVVSEQLNFDYVADFSILKNSFQATKQQQTFVLAQIAKINFYPFKNHLISPSVDHYLNRLTNSRQNNVYVDLLYRFTTSRKIDVELRCINLFNENNFITPSINNLIYFEGTFLIRPRQMLLSIRFPLS